MAKDKITEYDATAANNTVVGDVNLAENSALPSDMNNAVRELMSHQKEAFGSGTPLYVDQTNNRVGVGTVSPSQEMHLYAGSGATDLLIEQGTTGNAYLHTKNSNREYAIGTASDQLKFIDLTADAVRMSILSGGGLTFNGDTAAANALDDYEQGSYTPSFSFTNGNGTLSVSAAVGSYTKIGNRVHINFYIKIGTLGTASGDMRFSGLPFTPAAVSNRYHSGSLWMNTTNSTNELDGNFMTMLLLSPGDATIRPYFMAGGGGVGHANSGDVQNNTDFAVSMSYDTE